jgi:acyl-CoA reductase-like NAD-dependent aldehyde dehydrogenase
METINPATGERLKTFDAWNDAQLEAALANAAAAGPAWQATPFAERARLFRRAAAELRDNTAHYAGIITLEMGKVIREARAEIEKCAWGCEFYAEHAEAFLRDEVIRDRRQRKLRQLSAARRRAGHHAVEFPLLAGIPLRRAGPDGRQRRAAETRLERPAMRARDCRNFPQGRISRREFSRRS